MRRPWNISNSPIYSLVTFDDNILNMNICSYVSVVNMTPKIYAISLDYNTKTYKNIIGENSNIVLQLLSEENINVVRKLGKQSGNNFNKYHYLKQKQLLTQWNSIDVLKNTSALIMLEHKDIISNLPDHSVLIFDVLKYKSNRNDVLTFNQLIDKKIIL